MGEAQYFAGRRYRVAGEDGVERVIPPGTPVDVSGIRKIQASISHGQILMIHGDGSPHIDSRSQLKGLGIAFGKPEPKRKPVTKPEPFTRAVVAKPDSDDGGGRQDSVDDRSESTQAETEKVEAQSEKPEDPKPTKRRRRRQTKE